MKIFVATMKKYDFKLPNNYHYLKVGAKKSVDQNRLEYNDDINDNISELNPYFCELTAHYWVWKNINDDIVGLMHYRRYLSINKLFNNKLFFLKKKRIEKDLLKYDFISSSYYKLNMTVKENLLGSIKQDDYNKLEYTIKNMYPDYYDTFFDVMNSNRTYLCNIIISKKDLYNKYCEWLFPILFEIRKTENFDGYTPSEKRLYGYLAERLFTVYVLKNNFKVKSYSLVNIEVSTFKKIKDKVKCLFT